MALVGTIATGGYVVGPSDDKDNSGFEFTRRKKWPSLLLQELVGSAVFCLKPLPPSPSGSSHSSAGGMGWKMMYASPAAGDMLNQKAADLEGRDFFDHVFAPDQPHLQNLFSSLLTPQPPSLAHHSSSSDTTSSSNATPPFTSTKTKNSGTSGSSRSQTTYVRMMADQPVVWELRAHATGMERIGHSLAPTGTGPGSALNPTGTSGGSFGFGGQGTMVPSGSGNGSMGGAGDSPSGGVESGLKGKAVWVMGRRVAEGNGEGEVNGQNLDAFLELKLENERLREELREAQADLDEEDLPITRPLDPTPAYQASSPLPTTPSSASSDAESSEPKPKKRKEKDDREKKRLKKPGMGMGPSAGAPGPGGGAGIPGGVGSGIGAGGGGGVGSGGEGMHVCVTCGRTDSPEWRKGPLGPKTLCNACGLRWAKRNSTAPSRKDRKLAEGKK